MSKEHAPAAAAKRRIFLSAGRETFQLFSVTQNPNDGSLYFSAPDFANINWLVPQTDNHGKPFLLSYNSDGDGKLSLHGSGVVHVRPYEQTSEREFSVHGNALKSHDGSSLGLRHLLTIFFPQPQHLPMSPAHARKSDYVLQAKELHPYVLIMWAVPAVRPLTVQIKSSFNADDLEEVPPNGGWGGFNMLLHCIVWFAYRTKHLLKWPRGAQACYYDGYLVPMLIGTGEGAFRMELRRPTYAADAATVSIAL